MKLSKGTRLFILGAVLVVIDQIIKVLVKTNMSLGETIDVLGDWFKLHYVLNEGMAFGMAFGGFWGKALLSVFRIVLFGALCWWISGLAKKKDTPTGVLIGLTMITAGAMGNIIDCFFYGLIWPEITMPGAPFPFLFGRVVDMFYFPLFDYKLPWMDHPQTFSVQSSTSPTAASPAEPSTCSCFSTDSFQRNSESARNFAAFLKKVVQ